MLLSYRENARELKRQYNASYNEGLIDESGNFYVPGIVSLLDRESLIENAVAFYIESLYWLEMMKMQVRIGQEFS